MQPRTIGVEGLSRVEGEGSLRVEVHDGTVTDVALEIFEPPRYFEALLVGRHFTEAPDITARICGICPVAYQMSACAAMEDACGVTVDDRVDSPAPAALLRRVDPEPRAARLPPPRAGLPRLRRRRASWPSATGPPSSGASASSAPATWSWRPSGAGPSTRSTCGSAASTGRRTRQRSRPWPSRLRRARDAALATVEWVAGFDFPDVPGDYRFVALRDAEPLPHRARPAGLLRRPRR